jgi:protein-disulfide isomerase
MPKLDAEYIKTGKLKYAVRDLPLESIHPNAFKAAEAAHCAGEQGKYWELHERLFGNQRALNRPDLSTHAKAVGLEVAAFDQCVDSGKYTARVRKDIAETQKLGISGTPTFVVGVSDESGTIKNGRLIRGALPFESLKATIEELLSSAK